MQMKLENLNEKQLEAVKTTEGPVLILAGAGSGKTRVITQRIAYLISRGVPAYNILAITFTNKAAGEMRERVYKLLGQEPPKRVKYFSRSAPNMGTFHSICAQILRKESKKLGYKTNFTIYDESDQKAAVKKAMENLELDTEQFLPKNIVYAISSAKSELMSPEDYSRYASSFFQEIVEKVYSEYERILFDQGAMDFDDLITKTLLLFKKNPETLQSYQSYFKYILVDEYQDTNKAQYELIKMLAQVHKNICAVGDNDQSIYGWRGADFRNLMKFESDFPKTKVIMLEENYRSTQNILEAANKVIRNNSLRKDKNLWTKGEKGDKLIYFQARDEKDEAEFVVRKIRELEKLNDDFSNFVILYRTNAQSRSLEETFLKYDLPYKIIGGVRFYERAEIKDIVAYLRTIYNPMDLVALERIINMPARGITEKTWRQIVPLWQEYLNDKNHLKKNIDRLKTISDKAKKSLARFIDLLALFQKSVEDQKLGELIDFVAKGSGYKDFLLSPKNEDKKLENEARWENIQELKSVAEEFHGMPTQDALAAFLEEVSLISDIDQYDNETKAISLMTAHSAKGLEFKNVFIVGLEENLFPHSRSLLEPTEMEEERRLFYVAMTRAKKRLFLSSTKQRMYFGSTQRNLTSRFISEIPENLLDKEVAGALARLKQKTSGSGLNSKILQNQKSAIIDLCPGDQVIHKTFGEGVVIKMEGSVAEIAFSQFGIKKIAVDLAPIKKK